MNWMEKSKKERVTQRAEWSTTCKQLSHSAMRKESNEHATKETPQTNKQRALTNLQVLFSWVFTCFRFVSTKNMLLCLLLCLSLCSVSSIQSSSVFPYLEFFVNCPHWRNWVCWDVISTPCKINKSKSRWFSWRIRKVSSTLVSRCRWSGKVCDDLFWNYCTSTPHRSETNGIAERAVRRMMEGTLCCIVAIGSRWKLVGGFYGMLHLSAKRHRSIVWWEEALWKMCWTTIIRTDFSIWFIGWVST